jgi:hypothetical protein
VNDCTHCKYAKWERTAAGKLHPSGQGRCGFEVKIPQLPASMHYLMGNPIIVGGGINRREPSCDCPYFDRTKPDTGKPPGDPNVT